MISELVVLKNNILEENELDELTEEENVYLEGVTGLNETLRNPDTTNDLLVSLAWDAALALGATDEQAAEFCGDTANQQPDTIDLDNLLMTDGYPGSMGKTWNTPNTETFEQAVAGAMQMHNLTRAEVLKKLADGQALRWCEAPNHYYNHSYGIIGRKRTPAPVETLKCDCGHTVARSLAMTASMGTSCPDCYDRMSA